MKVAAPYIDMDMDSKDVHGFRFNEGSPWDEFPDQFAPCPSGHLAQLPSPFSFFRHFRSVCQSFCQWRSALVIGPPSLTAHGSRLTAHGSHNLSSFFISASSRVRTARWCVCASVVVSRVSRVSRVRLSCHRLVLLLLVQHLPFQRLQGSRGLPSYPSVTR